LAKQEEAHAYSPAAVVQLLERINNESFRSELAKGEVLSILNLRPNSTALLSTVVEDMEDRFTEDEQAKLVEIIGDVLGRDDPPVDAEEDENAMLSIENGY
jgi:hypothetical protein